MRKGGLELLLGVDLLRDKGFRVSLEGLKSLKNRPLGTWWAHGEEKAKGLLEGG